VTVEKDREKELVDEDRLEADNPYEWITLAITGFHDLHGKAKKVKNKKIREILEEITFGLREYFTMLLSEYITKEVKSSDIQGGYHS